MESLATAQAIDRIDPFERQSEPDRVLRAMGISNIISSLLGGLTVIPGGVKSKTCIEAGGRTLWANFYNAFFLLIFLFIAPTLIALIPKATLGAILVYTGWKMIHPSIGRHLASIGTEQIVCYTATILAILATDLLVGVLIGTAVKLAMLLWLGQRAANDSGHGEPVLTMLADFFRTPVRTIEIRDNGEAEVFVFRPLVSFNSYKLHEALASLPDHIDTVHITLEEGVLITDHTSIEGMLKAQRNLTIHGLDEMTALSRHRTSIHAIPAVAQHA